VAESQTRSDAILSTCPGVTFICLDVANGYSEYFVSAVKTVREKWPQHTIIAGNVVTNESAFRTIRCLMACLLTC
jgi:GMP reductase